MFRIVLNNGILAKEELDYYVKEVEWTYNSNAIEGNTLTIYETKIILEGITVEGKSLKEHLGVINHKEAISYLESLVKNKIN